MFYLEQLHVTKKGRTTELLIYTSINLASALEIPSAIHRPPNFYQAWPKFDKVIAKIEMVWFLLAYSVEY